MMKKDGRRRSSPTGFVIVRLRRSAARSGEAKSLAEFAKRAEMTGILRVLERLGNPRTERLIQAVSPDRLLEMERKAAASEFPPLNSLTQYWKIDLRDRDRAEALQITEMLRDTREFEMVEEEIEPMPAVVNPGDDPYNAGQGYQDPAPAGIDARWMWTQPDGEGAGVGVVDIEGGWLVTHEDLVGKAPTLIHGAQSTDPGWVDHGTAVLGEIAATDNSVGVVGTAPAIASVRMSSIFDAAQNFHVEDAFVAAVASMAPGEILLIELQIGFLPMETQDPLLDVMRLATALGILVVEAAGNGNSDLDAWTDGGGLQRMNRGSPDFVDSGALMVGACVSTVPHERWAYSNYGSRIDCFGWGENVTTCGYGDLDNGGGDPNAAYTDTFQGTSSASPIIVSAAALVQSRHKSATGSFMSPTQVRAVLSNPAAGTAQGTSVAGAIGVMPNLAAIVPGLGLTADVYLRDAVGDTGVIPWTGPISASPDVIVRPVADANPQASFGEGSGTENSDTLGYEVEAGQDNFIYVRARNRGGVAAANVMARVYWSPVATLVTPSLWTLVGSTTLASVPVGDVLTVSDAIVWPKAAIPATGHYCFVATLDHAGDPAPPVPGSMTMAQFWSLITSQNNVTWRNFNVVNDLPDVPTATPPFEFLVTGAGRDAEPFELEVERRLPRDARLILEGPALLIRRFARHGGELKVDRRRNASVILPALPRINLGRLTLNERTRHACRLTVVAGKTRLGWGNGVAVRQLYQGREVGRISWQFRPQERLQKGRKEREKVAG